MMSMHSMAAKQKRKDPRREGVSCGPKEARCKEVSDGRVISDKFLISKPLTKEYRPEWEEQWRGLQRQKEDMQPEKVTNNQMELIKKRPAAAGARLEMESNGYHGSVLSVRTPIDHLANTHRTSKKGDVKIENRTSMD